MTRTVRRLPLFLLLVTVGLASSASRAFEETSDSAVPPSSIEVSTPSVVIVGVPATILVKSTGYLPTPSVPVEIRDATGLLRAEGLLEAGSEVALRVTPIVGSSALSVVLPTLKHEAIPLSLRTLPGWLTLLPPLIAIGLALAFRQVIPALLGGVWIGAWMLHGGPLTGVLRTMDHYIVRSLYDPDRIAIILFTLMLGGMVAIVSRSGGTIGLVDALTPYATNSRRGQLVTWFLGLVIFFDDYANTLLVGNTMRPVTDRLKISREKLAYIVDSTAAPVASIALVSTWIGYEVSLIGESLKRVGSDLDPYSVFLQSLPYNFYPILALFFGLVIAATRRDFGPMSTAERRAAGGRVMADTAVPLSDFDSEGLAPPAGKPRRWINAVAPVLVVLVLTFTGLWFTGRASLVESGSPLGTESLFSLGIRGIGSVFGEGNSFHSLLYASLGGCLTALGLALGQRILTLSQSLSAWVGGMKSMTMALVILVLAWSIADVCSDLGTSGFMVARLSDNVDPRLLPAIVFLLAALTAFSTGTSWGTMGILIPLAVPTAYGLAQAAALDPSAAHRILLGSISAVLAGAIFGDHCSPISDTTVLSSTASGCDHVDHVRTQLPYALAVAAVALLVGYLPAGYGMHPILALLLAAGTLAGGLYLIGRRGPATNP